jgi:hypothetical protein
MPASGAERPRIAVRKGNRFRQLTESGPDLPQRLTAPAGWPGAGRLSIAVMSTLPGRAAA